MGSVEAAPPVGRPVGRRWDRLTGAVCAVYALGAAVAWGTPVTAAVMGDFGLAAAALTAAASCAAYAAVAEGRARSAWVLFAVSSLTVAAGNGAWGWYEVVLGTSVPAPCVADYAFLLFAPAAIAGLLLLTHRRRTVAGWACLVLDGWLVAGSLLTLAWSLTLARTVRGDRGDPLRTVLGVAYPVLDILLVGVVVLGVRARGRDRNRALGAVLAALALTVLCDALWTTPAVRAGYHSGELLDAGWFAGSMLLARAPWVRRRRAWAGPAAERSEAALPGAYGALTLYVAAGVCVAGLLRDAVDGRPMDGAVLAIGCTVALALIVRQAVTLRENLCLAQKLAHQEAHFRSLVQGSSDVIMIAGPDGVLRYVSPAALRVYGRAPEELVGGRFLDLVHPEDVGRIVGELRRFLTLDGGAEPVGRLECRIRSGAGEWLHVESAVNRHRDGLIFNSRDVSERVRLQAQLRHNAFHDALTGLPNRALFTDRVRAALDAPPAGGPAAPGHAAAVLYLDLDGFKAVNDSAGHQTGDELLVLAARRLGECVGAGGTVARLGGDEFAALVAGPVGEPEAREVADRLRRALSEPYAVGGGRLIVAASIGIALGGPGADPADLLRDADLAMYRAKSAGRGGVAVHRLPGEGGGPEPCAEQARRRARVAQRVRTAVPAGTVPNAPVEPPGAPPAVVAVPGWSPPAAEPPAPAESWGGRWGDARGVAAGARGPALAAPCYGEATRWRNASDQAGRSCLPCPDDENQIPSA